MSDLCQSSTTQAEIADAGHCTGGDADAHPAVAVEPVIIEDKKTGLGSVDSTDAVKLKTDKETSLSELSLLSLFFRVKEKRDNPVRARWRFLKEHAGFLSRVPPLVKAKLEILHVWGVDLKTESFCVEIRVHCEWKCPDEDKEGALKQVGDALDVDWEPEWYPLLSVRSTMGILYEAPNKHLAYKKGEQVIIEGTYRWACQVHDNFDLHDYPFDIQDLSLRLEIRNAPAFDTTALRENIQVMNTADRLPDLNLMCAMPFMFRAVSSKLDKETHVTRENIANQIHIVLWYKRAAEYAFWNHFSLLFAVTSCACASWSLHWRDVADRLGLDITLLLVAVAFKQVLAQDLPPISYLTFLDRYALLGVSFLLLATLMHAALGFMMWDCDAFGFCEYYEHLQVGMVEAYQIDNVMLIVWVFLWTWYNAYKIAETYWKMDCNARLLDPENVKRKGFEVGSLSEGSMIEHEYLPMPVYSPIHRLPRVFCSSPWLVIFTLVGIGISGLLTHQVVTNSDHISAAPAPVFKLPD
mmetsp:Transcript_23363/g.42612  ORF Transcript_23363/g.42612 Transcript_23363/m.42612 type:complete len:524 (+) Transcript_23363:67-1638(+)